MTGGVTDDFAAARPRLVGLAYRMLGSLSDAEDVVQDAWLRWSRTDRGVIANADAFLTTTVARLALDALRRRRREQQRYVGPWLPEPIVQPADPVVAAEIADSMTLAFLLLLERLTPDERAAFLLADVFAAPFAEIAATLGRSEQACRQLASRGRRKLREEPFARGDAGGVARQLADRFVRALAAGDEAGALGCVADDAVMLSDGGPSRHAARYPVVGAVRIVRLLANLARRLPPGAVVEQADVGGAPGIVVRDGDEVLVAIALEVSAARIVRVLAVVNPDKLEGIHADPAAIE